MGDFFKNLFKPAPIQDTMHIREKFAFLVDEYGMEYSLLYGDSYAGIPWEHHCFYNKSGCFTITWIYAVSELSFSVTDKFAEDYDRMLRRSRRVESELLEEDVWYRTKRWGILPRCYVGWSNKEWIENTVESIKTMIARDGSFLDISVKPQK